MVATLALTQTVGYGVLYYAFPVLLIPIATDLGTSPAAVTGALTMSVLVAAAAAIPVGRWLDRHGGRLLMTAGSGLGIVAVLGWSQVTSLWQLYAVFVVIGLAGAMSLYEAAFAVLVATATPGERSNALLGVSIVAGFASSIFFPVTALLNETFGWRAALVILAGLLAAFAVPGHAFAVPGHGVAVPVLAGAAFMRRRETHSHEANGPATNVRRALRERGFWLLTVAFVAHAAAVSTMAVHLVRVLVTAGHTTTVAASLAGMLGVLSVTGRLATTGLARRYSLAVVTAVVFLGQSAGAAALPTVADRMIAAAACVTAFGLGFGVATVARPAILADRYPIGGYATIAATMATPITIAKAAAPLGAAALEPGLAVTRPRRPAYSAGLRW